MSDVNLMADTLSECSHTPGPWKVIPPGHGHPSEYQCVQYGADERYTSLEMLPADARLTAAAPDLLAALKAMDTAICDGFDTQATRMAGRKALIATRAAIAKAEGRS